MAKLSQILKTTTKVDFEFIDMLQDEAQRDGSTIVRLVLKTPIDSVMGRRVNDPGTGDAVPLLATDVSIINIGKEALDAIERMEEEDLKKPENERNPIITWTVEGKSGRFTTNKLKLDVSQALEVWIVETSLRQFGINQRNERRKQQQSNLVAKIRENQTKKEFKGLDVNNPQANEGTGAGAGTDAKPKPETVATTTPAVEATGAKK